MGGSILPSKKSQGKGEMELRVRKQAKQLLKFTRLHQTSFKITALLFLK